MQELNSNQEKFTESYARKRVDESPLEKMRKELLLIPLTETIQESPE